LGARATQTFVEVLQAPAPRARATQAFAEVLRTVAGQARATQVFLEVLRTADSPSIYARRNRSRRAGSRGVS